MKINKYWKQGLIGLTVLILGIATLNGFGGAGPMQAATTPDAFAQASAKAGNNGYYANLGDIFLLVPGLLILLLAIMKGLGVSAVGILGRIKRYGVMFAWLYAGADTIENIITLIATGFANLDAPNVLEIVSPSEELIRYLGVISKIKFGSLGVSGVIIILLLIAYIFRKVNAKK